jgi:hypothetical protein
MTSLGVVLAITNPLSSGYLAPIAAIESWRKLADRILIIDGGSTDNSIQFLKDSFGDTVEIISNATTYWGHDDNWNLLQLGVNLNYGIGLLDTDWAYAFSSDYVPLDLNRNHLHSVLQKYSEYYWIRTHVAKPINGKVRHRFNARNVILNLRKIKQMNLKVVYGLNNHGPTDTPIIADQKASFIDPVNGIKKIAYKGQNLTSDIIADLECVAYGHFFYNMNQLEYKIQRWDRAASRFEGYAPSRLIHLKYHHGIHSIVDYFEKSRVWAWDHPLEIKALIEQFYEPGMIGGIKQMIPSRKEQFINKAIFLFRAERKIRTLYSKLFGGLKAQKDELFWEKT